MPSDTPAQQVAAEVLQSKFQQGSARGQETFMLAVSTASAAPPSRGAGWRTCTVAQVQGLGVFC